MKTYTEGTYFEQSGSWLLIKEITDTIVVCQDVKTKATRFIPLEAITYDDSVEEEK